MVVARAAMNDNLNRKLVYPVYLIEDKKRPLNISNVVYGKTGFITFSRVPAKGKFVKGHLFDSAGVAYRFEGECGWPRYSGWLRVLAELVFIPTLLSKVLEFFVYFGPDLKTSTPLSLDDFRTGIVEATSLIGKKDIAQLKNLLDSKKDYRSVIEGVDWWRYNAGKRDEDGHPL